MKHALFTALVALASFASFAEEKKPESMPEMPTPQKQHEWLHQLAGEWEVTSTVNMPGDEKMTFSGTESVRVIGGFWVVAEGSCTVMDTPSTSIMTLGYDTAQQKYVGTFLSSGMDYLWVYSGKVEGKKLILETSGACPMMGGKIAPFREVIEIKNENERTFTSSVQLEDGSWQQMFASQYTRKK